MNKIFELQNGKIEFLSDKIIVTDKARSQRKYNLISSGIWIFYGTMSVLRYLKTGDQFLLWTGLFIGLAHLWIFVSFLLRVVESEISVNDIKSLKLKAPFGNNNLDIKLKNGRTRRVSQVYATKEFRDYIDQFQTL